MIVNAPHGKGKSSRYSQADIDALKSPDILRAYCDKMLGQPQSKGASLIYPCPFGSHNNPHLEVKEYQCKGCAKCWACDKGGDVFTVAQALNEGLKFGELIEHVAQVVGYSLRSEEGRARGGNRRAPRVDFSKRVQPPAPKLPPPISFLPDEMQKEAWRAVDRANVEKGTLSRHAKMLGFPLQALSNFTNATMPQQGLLGLDRSGALLYMYTARDEQGKWKFTAVKRRGLPHESVRFTFWAGSKIQAPFGAGMLLDSETRRVIITEGESDFLAVSYSLHCWLEYIRCSEPQSFSLYEEIMPLVLAKPNAKASIEGWATCLKGLEATICADVDNAGKDGAQKTIQELKKSGVNSIYAWRGQGEAKDAREAFDLRTPCALIESIFLDKKEIL